METSSKLIYDGSFEGFLTTVFVCYEERLNVVNILPQHLFEQDFFSESQEIITDDKKADRVWKGLAQFPIFRHHVYWSFLSEIEKHEMTLLKAIQYVLKTGNSKDYGQADVLKTAQFAKMVGREKHRMEAFVRFQLTQDGIYFSKIEPDFNVLPLISKHFKNRYADQQWIIYDLKRNYGLYYDLNTVAIMQMDFSEAPNKEDVFAGEELAYDKLWRNYFKSTNIKSRINLKLHTRHIPKRYWKYLNEKLSI